MKETFDIKSIVYLLLHNLWLILIMAILCASMSLAYVKLFVTPVYSSSITLYVSNNQNVTNTISNADITTSQKLVSTYRVIMNSNKVLSAVIADSELDMTPAQLRSLLKVRQESETEIMRVVATTEDPLLSAKIANSVAKVAPNEILRVSKAGYVEIIDEASPATSPDSNALKRRTMIGAIVGTVLAIIIIFVKEMFDTTLKTKAELQQLLDVPVLGEIPKFDENAKRGVTYGKE
ncbi:MAG: hypothetical protein IKV58_00730 [Oscillospiraceae bacterium]|nr:hypothetical protein [Oscillospiraceae bacterium]